MSDPTAAEQAVLQAIEERYVRWHHGSQDAPSDEEIARIAVAAARPFLAAEALRAEAHRAETYYVRGLFGDAMTRHRPTYGSDVRAELLDRAAAYEQTTTPAAAVEGAAAATTQTGDER